MNSVTCTVYSTVQYSTGDLTSWHSTMGKEGWIEEGKQTLWPRCWDGQWSTMLYWCCSLASWVWGRWLQLWNLVSRLDLNTYCHSLAMNCFGWTLELNVVFALSYIWRIFVWLHSEIWGCTPDFGERRPPIQASPGVKRLLVLSHLRHYAYQHEKLECGFCLPLVTFPYLLPFLTFS